MTLTQKDAMLPEDRFERLYRAEAGRVLQYVTHRVGRSGAEDLVAETFTIAWRRLDDIPDPARPWLLGVARRVVANSLRRKPADSYANSDLEDLAVPGAPFTDGVDRRRDLLQGLRVLPPQDREALLLATWYDLTNAQAAQVMGCSQTAFAVRLHRARRRLRRALDELDTTPHPAPLPEEARR